MPTQTNNLDLTLPTPDVDTGWGSTLNTDFVKIDDIFDADGGGTAVGINIGSAKTAVIRGTLILGNGDGTSSTSAATIRGPDKTGTNETGQNLTISAGNGTGTGGSGRIILRTAPAGASGTTANTFTNALTVDRDSNIGIGLLNATQAVHVYRSTAVDTYVKTQNSVSSGYVGMDLDGRMRIWNEDNASLLLGTNNSEKIRINNNGAFGVWDSSLVTPAANFGTSGQILKSNGTGSPPSWVDEPLGWRFVTKVDFDGSSPNASVTGLSSYEAIRITITNLNTSTGTSPIGLRLYDGSNYLSSNYSGGYFYISYTSGGDITNNTYYNSTYAPLGTATTQANNSNISGVITIGNFNVPRNTTIYANMLGSFQPSSSSFFGSLTNSTVHDAQTAMSGIRLLLTSGNLTGGNMVVEGLVSA